MPHTIKGWCPGAHRPMQSGDGWIVRVRPRLARLTARQAKGLAEAACEFGNGLIDLTSRANLQIRGVAENRHGDLLSVLERLELLDHDPLHEARRNILVTPFWRRGDLTQRLADSLEANLSRLPDLPGKMGFAVDTGPRPMLQAASADFRFEKSEAGTLLLRADGCASGREISAATAVEEAIEMAEWFVATGGTSRKRMARHLQDTTLPREWQGAQPAKAGDRLVPGATETGEAYGVAFGSMKAEALLRLLSETGADALRLTPWRILILEDARPAQSPDFIAADDDPILNAHACPGAPFCAAATVETRKLATDLANHVSGTLHVSGCAKGCAHQGVADITLIGREGRFDLVYDGAVDAPATKTGLTPEQAITELT